MMLMMMLSGAMGGNKAGIGKKLIALAKKPITEKTSQNFANNCKKGGDSGMMNMLLPMMMNGDR